MPETLHRQFPAVPLSPLGPTTVEVDERAARESLREQIARLESELSSLFCSTFPRDGFDWRVRGRGGPRLLGLGELERVRDDLAERLGRNRAELGERTRVEEANRCLIEEMMLDPAAHQWVRVQNADIGERGCKQWHVRPRWGVLGILMSWWRVHISSGCPLAMGRGRSAAAPTPTRGSPHDERPRPAPSLMGRRSRKRLDPATGSTAPAGSRAERDAARAARAQAAKGPSSRRGGDRPDAPWGRFPLTELVVLLALVFLVLGFVLGIESGRGRVLFGAGLALGALSGLELAIRDHFAGYRSHSTLLAAACAVGAMVVFGLILRQIASGLPAVILFAVGAVVFAVAFPSFRKAFQRRSGGASFR